MSRRQMQDQQMKMTTNASAIGNVLDVLKSKLQILEAEIKADQKGAQEYEAKLHQLREKRNDRSKRLSANMKWAAVFDKEIGPFQSKYGDLTRQISDLYNNAKDQHAKGLELLIAEFNYHPMFKRPQDNFTAIPFRPK